MQYTATLLVLALTFGSTVQAHMDMLYPPPFRSKANPHVGTSGNVDYSATSPVSQLCKGFEVDLGTPAGASVVTYKAGGKYNLTIEGGAAHGGGSCQVSISTTGKVSDFKVIQSIEGDCPTASGGTFDFTVPADTPATSTAMLAWTWVNKIGNREFYMQCASIEITSGTATRDVAATAFSSRPDLFVANIAGTTCKTVESKNVKYPSPGPDLVGSGDEGSTTGDCGAASGGGSQNDTPAAPSASASPGTLTAQPGSPATSAAGTTLATVTSTASTAVAPPLATGTGTSPVGGTLKISNNGVCGGASGSRCASACCSSSGFCGYSDQHCGTGCQAAFGSGCGRAAARRGFVGRLAKV